MRLPGQVVLFVIQSKAETVDEARATAESGESTLDKEESVDIGGVAATRCEIGGTGGGPPLVETPFAELSTDPDEEAARPALLDVNGTIIAVVEIGSPDNTPSSWSETQKVIDTIVWATT